MRAKEIYKMLIEQNEAYESLIKALYEQLGCDDENEFLQQCDLCCAPHNVGANAGFTGFIYYSETKEFYESNREKIIEMLNDLSEGIGDHSCIATVMGFNNAQFTEEEVALTLYGNHAQVDKNVADALAKFAFERIANKTTDIMYEHQYNPYNND